MARHVLTDYQITADTVSKSIPIGGRAPFQLWMWKVTTTGTGTNQLGILAKQVANSKDEDDDQVLFTLSAAKLYRGPRIITTGMIDAAANNTLLATYQNPVRPGAIKLDFDYSGGSARTFVVNLWIEG